MSFELVELQVAASTRREARFILQLAQAINAGWSKDSWRAVQSKLLSQMRTGL